MWIKLAYKDNMNFDLDGYVCELMNLHFDPKEGTPYWLRQQKNTGIDYRREITSVDDLWKLDYANAPDGTELMSLERTRDLVPKKILREEMTKLIPGETTGTRARKYPMWDEDYLADIIRHSNYILDLYGVPKGEDWLNFIPSYVFGRHFIELARSRGGILYPIPTDSLLGKKVLLTGDQKKIDEIFGHAFNQMMSKSKIEKIGVTLTLPLLFPILSTIMDVSNLKALLWAGTYFPAKLPYEWKNGFESFKEAKEQYKGIILGGIYGNGMFGQAWYISDGTNRLNYYPPEPYVRFEVINRDMGKNVKYGERGQLVITTLRKTLLSRWKERDAANRIPPFNNFDGIQNVGPLETIDF